MLYLIKLEMKKTKMSRMFRKAVVTDLILLGLILTGCVLSVYGPDKDEVLLAFPETLTMISVVDRAVFLIFSSVMMNRLTVSEYKERTILQLFTYPIQRKKLFTAKLLIVFVFTIAAVALSGIVNGGALYLLCKCVKLLPDVSLKLYLASIPDCLIGAIMCGFLSMVPFYFGMRKKSSSSTIVSSVIVSVFLSSNLGNVTMPSYMLRLAILGGLSAVLAIYTVCVKLNQLESSDL